MRSLSRLLSPKSIAVIGGGVWCRSLITQVRKIGFVGEIYIAHPTANEIEGITPYHQVTDFPNPPDAAFIGVNRETTIKVVGALASMRAGGAVCFASGFRETADGGSDNETADLQAQLASASGDMPILGPNCYGFINYLDSVCLWPDQHGGIHVEGGVAIITQSSNMAISLTMQKRGLRVAYMITVGNQAQTSLADIGQHVLRDHRVTALGLHIEGIDNHAKFEAMAKTAHDLGKGIVAIKVGRSAEAQAATISHTASIAGSDTGADALLRRLGIARVDGLSDFVETLKLLDGVGPLAGNRIASLSCSGGEASLIADLALTRELEFTPLNEAQKSQLASLLGDRVALANPLDYHTYIWGDDETMGGVYTAMMQGEVDLGVVIVDFPRSDLCDPSAWECVLNAVATTRSITKQPLIISTSLPENIDEELICKLRADGTFVLCGLYETMVAIEAAARIGRAFARSFPPSVWPTPKDGGGKTLTEASAKVELLGAGVNVPASMLVNKIDQLETALDQLAAPYVLKGQGWAHKTEAGAVALGLDDAAAVIAAAEDMARQNAAPDGYLVEEMIGISLAELLIGVVADPAHGFLLTIGAGGIMTELIEDRVTLILPISEDDVRSALRQLAIAPLFDGFRGKPPADRKAVIDVVMAIQSYVRTHRSSMQELEINPLIVAQNGATAVDALIRQGETI